MGTLRQGIDAVEAWLRIDRSGAPEDLNRARAVYVVAACLIVVQLVNLFGSLASFRRLDEDLLIIFGAILVFAGSIVALRWTKFFAGYAALYGILTFAAIAGAAVPSGSGIYTNLIPFICIGPMIIAYIHSWKSALIYTGLGMVFLFLLYQQSLADPVDSWATDHRTMLRWLQAEIALVISGFLASVFSASTFHTLREQQASVKRANKAEAAKSEFLATMSHELRTPLNGVIGMSEALCVAHLPDRERELAETIRRSGESLLVIIGDLLDLSKIEAGKLTIEKQPFSPSTLVRHTVDAWRDAAHSKGVRIDAKIFSGGTDLALGDEHRIGQILQNLVSNAVKFTEQGSIEVSLRSETQRDDVVLSFRVRDSGRGISPEVRDSIFNAFEQGEQGTTRRFGGTGLGLPICRLLTELMDGSISIEDTGPDGTTFLLRLRLPAAQENEAPLKQSVLRSNPTFTGLRVLVAEDNHVNQMVIREFLKAWGASMVFADDGPSALEALETDQFDLVLLDKHMPGMSGLDVAVRIRKADAAYRTIPIIAVSADTLEGEREEALAAGMDGYVSKPVRPEVLRLAMEAVLRPPNTEAREEISSA